jgi:hypothetical protein
VILAISFQNGINRLDFLDLLGLAEPIALIFYNLDTIPLPREGAYQESRLSDNFAISSQNIFECPLDHPTPLKTPSTQEAISADS